MADTSTDWQAEAIRLRREEQMDTAAIAERVDRSASRVRRVLAEANAARFTGEHVWNDGAVTDDEGKETANSLLNPPEPPIPGQVDIDGNEHRDPLEDFKAEAGEAVGPMPAREMDGGEVVETAPFVKGTVQLALDFGPNAAPVAGATIIFKSEKLASGFFEMGDVVTGKFTARITGVAGSEKLDKDLGEFVARPQAQTATITEIRIGDVGGDG